MMLLQRSRSCAPAALAVTMAGAASVVFGAAPALAGVTLEEIGRYKTGIFGASAAEISAYDAGSRRLFTIDSGGDKLMVLDVSDPTNPAPVPFSPIDLSPYGASPNSVAAHGGLIAVAMDADPSTDPGSVVFFDRDGKFLKQIEVGAGPDMLTFTPLGSRVLVANSGPPSDDYMVDPKGSVSIIDLTAGVRAATVATADFTAFNGQEEKLRASGVRIFGPNASVAEDLEPEYIDIAPLSPIAFVTMQENNAVARVNILTAKVEKIIGLGLKDHSAPGNGLDPSDRDGGININPWPVFGMYEPDGIAVYRTGWPLQTYFVTANEGDARDFPPAFSEEIRVGDLAADQFDPKVFPDAARLRDPANLGRLRISRVEGITETKDGRPIYGALHAYGARSFSIWTADGTQVFDSGDQFEQITADLLGVEGFNSNHEEGPSFDNRSDDKGPEPSNVTIGHVGLEPFAFITLERVGGIIVYDISDPTSPAFCDYVNNRNFDVPYSLVRPPGEDPGDLGPEGVLFIPWWQSPTLKPLLVVSNEVSDTVTIYRVTHEPGPCRAS
ncbi:MAG TPA: choice-of-anchor I family protein [Geminicoccaceae bacterium]|nr:choice-of-anchor I family protein [Geminicoccaceae bacterium]